MTIVKNVVVLLGWDRKYLYRYIIKMEIQLTTSQTI
nr:MAG TPA: hypothetical protein [Caudoviricetes sp.]